MIALGLVGTMIGVIRWTWACAKIALLLSPIWIPAALIAHWTTHNAKAETVALIRAVDGDTVIVTVHGTDTRLRVLGINSPESVKPNSPVECEGPEASDNAKRWADAHPRVVLRSDPAAPNRDHYGRLLRYVQPVGGGRDLSTVQVARGFARVAAYGEPLSKVPALTAAEHKAKRAGRGLWGACR